MSTPPQTPPTLLFGLLLSGLSACGGPSSDDTASASALSRGQRVDVIECRSDDPCPRGSYCETGLNYCFTGQRCIVDGRPSDRSCQATFGPGFSCLEYAPDSYHCVPTEQPELTCRNLISCRDDRACPRGAACDSGLHACLTPSRCIVDGRPSTRFCQATYGNDFVCREYATDSWHCAPVEVGACE